MHKYSELVVVSESEAETVYTGQRKGSRDTVTLRVRRGDCSVERVPHQFVRGVIDTFYYTSDKGENCTAIVLEHCPHSLKSMCLQQKQPFSEEFLWKILRESTEALAFAQGNNISHGNIHPETIFIGEDGNVRIEEFYSVEQSGDPQNQTSAKLASHRFLSPEFRQHLTRQLRAPSQLPITLNPYKSDMFSLGYSLLVTSLLRDSNCGRVLNGLEINIANEVGRLSNYSQEYRSALLKMLSFSAELRPDFLCASSSLQIPAAAPPSALIPCVMGEHRETRGEERVQLPCGHEFCSKACLREYVFTATDGYGKQLQGVVCKSCGQPITDPVIFTAFGGEEAFEDERKSLTLGCVFCTREAYTRKWFFCNHRICQTDWKLNNKPGVCPKCGSARDFSAKREDCGLF